jgi:hypothetical protein
MHAFLNKFDGVVRGVLCGFDRLFFRGSLRALSYCRGLQHYLWANRIPYKDFSQHSQQVSARLEEASLRQANQLGREIRYLNSAGSRKEDIAREIAARDRIRQGLICVLRSVDPCMSFQINKNHVSRKLEIRYRQRKCLHLYHYQIHPVFGFMHARIQTWFPFTIYVCLNGREWLARQMDQIGLHYKRRDNTFTWLEDVAKVQALFDQQVQANWPSLLGGLAEALNPAHADIFAKAPCRYYWSVQDSEWASDVMFASRRALEKVYPQLLRYAVTAFKAVDVLRFLGQPVPASGRVPHRFRGEVISNIKERLEGVRIKHWINHNSVKMYDKGSVLRAECMVRQPGDFKVYRPAEGDPQGPKAWRPLRRGIADLQRRAEVSQAANERYLDALAAVHDTTPLRELAEPLCRSALEPRRRARPPQAAAPATTTAAAAGCSAPAAPAEDALANGEAQAKGPAKAAGATADSSGTSAGAPTAAANNAAASGMPQATADAPVAPTGSTGRVAAAVVCAAVAACAVEAACPPAARRRVRALNPLGAADAALLEAVSRHEFLVNGVRNRDVRRLLYGAEAGEEGQRRRAAAVTRQLRLLRGHGLIHKVPRTHRYMVSEAGRRAITALLAARNSCAEELIRCAG